MDMKFLDHYDPDDLLESYGFIFAQWVGGASGPEGPSGPVPTVLVFEEILINYRNYILGRGDASIVKRMNTIEKKVTEKLTLVLNLSEKQLRELAEELVIQAEEGNRRIMGQTFNS